jgi:hypothetical protein
MDAQIGRELSSQWRAEVSSVGRPRLESRDADEFSLRQLVSWTTTERDRQRDGANLSRHTTNNPGNDQASDLGVIRHRAVFVWELRGLADQNPATRIDFKAASAKERQQSPRVTAIR